MVHNTQYYCAFALFPSSGIAENRKHAVLETGFISILRCGEDTYSQGNGPIRHIETCPDFFFSLQEYTQQNPL
jgi:hypothetical protein